MYQSISSLDVVFPSAESIEFGDHSFKNTILSPVHHLLYINKEEEQFENMQLFHKCMSLISVLISFIQA